MLNWPTIKKINNELDSVLDKHPEVFKDELGTLKDAKAQLFVKPGAVPKFHKPRPVPHAIKGAIEQELDRLENMGVLEKVRCHRLNKYGGMLCCVDVTSTVRSMIVCNHVIINLTLYHCKYIL